MSVELGKLVEAAGRSANAGRWREAESIWQQVLELEPAHPQALCSLGIHALQRGAIDEARRLLTAAREQAPGDMVVLMSLGHACRQLGDVAGEREAIDAALAVDAYFLPALLAKASWLERSGNRAAAAMRYAAAVKIAPPETQWPPMLKPQLEHARDFVEGRSRALMAHLEKNVRDRCGKLPSEVAARWREAVSLRAGRSKPYVSESNQLHVPRLPAIPFYNPEQFSGLRTLATKTDVIRAELQALLDTQAEGFAPYIAYNPGDPVNQWKDLNHSERWSAFHLWRGGEPVEENLRRCPETAKALAEVGMVRIDRLCPNALFSALAPHTHIPPHNGETNARLVAHLPLVVPDGCRFRVGFEEREWKVGELIVFDDTIEHEARNDSEELRVVLIFDLWNPLLTEPERELVNALATASREFDG